jgi:hypothetical protein
VPPKEPVDVEERAEIEIEAFLADSVESVEGKLYVLGAGWNVLHTPALPFRQARIGVG